MNQSAISSLSRVAILAGGFGTRLAQICDGLPKPMVPLLGKPTLQYQIELCRKWGFKDITLLVHHQSEKIVKHFGDGSGFGVNLKYSKEHEPRGTAGALLDSISMLADSFLVLYGDTYLDVDLSRLWNAHGISGADGTLFLHPNDHPQDSDIVELDQHGRVALIHPYPHPQDFESRNLVNAGLYVLEKSSLIDSQLGNAKGDIAKHMFPEMLRRGRTLYGYISPEYIKDMGTPERLKKVEGDIISGLPERLSGRLQRNAVFLDRDGTLNREVNHLTSPKELELLDGVAAAVKRLNRSGALAVAVTNQPVIARGEITSNELNKIHAKLEVELGLGGAYLDGIYVCPHHPDKGYAGEVIELKINCNCRKPNIGMIEKACQELLINPNKSWIIGDTTSDIEAGRRAGLKTILLRTGYAGGDLKYSVKPDYVCPNLSDAVEWILGGHENLKAKLIPIALKMPESIRVILIGGLARSGKSFAGQVLKEIFEASSRSAHVISLDGWLLPKNLRRECAVDGVLGRYDLQKATRLLGPLIGSAGEYRVIDEPLYDRVAGNSLGSKIAHHIHPEDIIIIEGVPALLMDGFADKMQVSRVYMEIDPTLRESRLFSDYRWRSTKNSSYKALVATREIDEVPIIVNSKKLADFIVGIEEKNDS